MKNLQLIPKDSITVGNVEAKKYYMPNPGMFIFDIYFSDDKTEDRLIYIYPEDNTKIIDYRKFITMYRSVIWPAIGFITQGNIRSALKKLLLGGNHEKHNQNQQGRA